MNVVPKSLCRTIVAILLGTILGVVLEGTLGMSFWYPFLSFVLLALIAEIGQVPEAPRIAEPLIAIGVSLSAVLASYIVWWVYLSPSLVEERILADVSLGMSRADVLKELGATDRLAAGRKICGPDVDAPYRYTSVEMGRLLTSPATAAVTTTYLCFDDNDSLDAIYTKRWADGP